MLDSGWATARVAPTRASSPRCSRPCRFPDGLVRVGTGRHKGVTGRSEAMASFGSAASLDRSRLEELEKRSPVLQRGFVESGSGSGFPPMMALARCLFAHPSVGGAQPTYKSLFCDAFLRRPAAAGAPCVTRLGGGGPSLLADSKPACPGVRYHAADCSSPLPGCRLSLGPPSLGRPRCPWLRASDLGPVLPTLSSSKR